MAIADDPRAFILRMFQMESNEGRGTHCQVFPNGTRPAGISLLPSELVYGIYKQKYFFTPTSLILGTPSSHQSIAWADIAACSTKHGCGEKQSLLTLTTGSIVAIRLDELAKGWSGRISQLLHGMIERWGSSAPLGQELLTIEDFFRRVDDDYSFAPNLEPHPSLLEVRVALETLKQSPGIDDVRLSRGNVHDEELAVTSVVVISQHRTNAIDQFAQALRANAVVAASENTRRKLGEHVGRNAWEVLWD
ncbi:hypothetical protein PMI15_04319 [Polaromonas sp. CF318]|uniref:hypothetical protein n=1 Tax=Polaromonas sp. CF318 TaxID=1144318 RepID=UPI000270FA16|nr:hypothetical protein [Polaromonas sp. CF318]EJL78470.1 hypothetical protein PMI15_04319 [Polaromonas sp. CF318]